MKIIRMETLASGRAVMTASENCAHFRSADLSGIRCGVSAWLDYFMESTLYFRDSSRSRKVV
jgi:hypothetical protein